MCEISLQKKMEEGFYVVFTPDDVSIVPQHWVVQNEDQKTVYWPKQPVFSKKKMLKMEIGSDWRSEIPRRIEGPYGKLNL